MEVIETQIDPGDERARANAKYHRALAEDLRRSLALARQGGGEKYQQRHRAPVGRRHPRPGRDAPGAGPGPRRQPQRADPGDRVWGIPDVSEGSSWHGRDG